MSNKKIQLKDKDGNNLYPAIVKQCILDVVYPVGSVYITINSANPHDLFGGTWEKITADAYLKIVTSNAGQTGGTSSNHKIPVESIPAHGHLYTNKYDNASTSGGSYAAPSTYNNANARYSANVYTQNAGGGQAYYPYYYGVIVWKRTA